MPDLKDEYDPARPNDYEEVLRQRQAHKEAAEREAERQQQLKREQEVKLGPMSLAGLLTVGSLNSMCAENSHSFLTGLCSRPVQSTEVVLLLCGCVQACRKSQPVSLCRHVLLLCNCVQACRHAGCPSQCLCAGTAAAAGAHPADSAESARGAGSPADGLWQPQRPRRLGRGSLPAAWQVCSLISAGHGGIRVNHVPDSRLACSQDVCTAAGCITRMCCPCIDFLPLSCSDLHI